MALLISFGPLKQKSLMCLLKVFVFDFRMRKNCNRKETTWASWSPCVIRSHCQSEEVNLLSWGKEKSASRQSPTQFLNLWDAWEKSDVRKVELSKLRSIVQCNQPCSFGMIQLCFTEQRNCNALFKLLWVTRRGNVFLAFHLLTSTSSIIKFYSELWLNQMKSKNCFINLTHAVEHPWLMGVT